jgi:uncharacterized protein (DUF2249 family)
MSQLSRAFRSHHQELTETLSRHVAALAEGRPGADVAGLAAFLTDHLLPHAREEEAHLYPAVEALIKAHGKATATMAVDHEFIGAYIRKIEETAEAWRKAGPSERAGIEGRLRYMAIQLEGIFKLHLEKEERVYLPLAEQHLSDEEKTRLLAAMHGEEQAKPSFGEEPDLDVRTIQPRDRHPLIFQSFERLGPGQGFVLVNDHDPKPLFYQFQAERGGQFTWDYLEQGTEVWRVRIGKRAAA